MHLVILSSVMQIHIIRKVLFGVIIVKNFWELQKKFLFLSGRALTPPPLLVAGQLKNNFFCGSPK